ncbi:glycosyltransferase [Ruegeria sediminis]|uniref:Glycosyltransferase n=1 Tax=Ruegeria sediminis TaxID=2583820 RepID=A0ABY2X4M0_9RHOB|nr:glycosyltransferase [Ruegeria sediminis]TMV10336.1 glycosyltransferase [Ruegeria sediminis]
MKIAHVTSILSRRGAGVRNVVEDLARAQMVQGLEVKVFGLTDPDFIAGEGADWAALNVSASPVIGPNSIGFSPALTRALKAWGPDIVHLHGLWTYPSKAVLDWHRATGNPYLVSVHGMLSKVALSYSPAKKRISRLLFQDRCFDGARALHATTETELAEIRALGYRGPIAIFPNGVNAAAIPDLPARTPGKTVLTLGRLHHKKGLDILIDIWAKLEPAFPDWSLRIIGPDENGYAARLKNRLKSHHLARCSVEAPVFGADKDIAIASSDLFVLPSRNENFALTVAESLIMEVPVVSSRNAPWQGLETEHCGLWVDLEPADFAAAMSYMMNLTDDERKQMGRNGRDWMLRDFSWSAISQRALAIYEWAGGHAPRTSDIHLAQQERGP